MVSSPVSLSLKSIRRLNHKKVQVKPTDTILRCYHRAIGKEKCFNVGHHPETFTFYEYCKNKGVKDVKFFAGFPNHSFNTIKTIIELGLPEASLIVLIGRNDEFIVPSGSTVLAEGDTLLVLTKQNDLKEVKKILSTVVSESDEK